MTFIEAYIRVGPDVELIAQLLGIKPHEADRLINQAMGTRYQARQQHSQESDVRRPA